MKVDVNVTCALLLSLLVAVVWAVDGRDFQSQADEPDQSSQSIRQVRPSFPILTLAPLCTGNVKVNDGLHPGAEFWKTYGQKNLQDSNHVYEVHEQEPDAQL